MKAEIISLENQGITQIISKCAIVYDVNGLYKLIDNRGNQLHHGNLQSCQLYKEQKDTKDTFYKDTQIDNILIILKNLANESGEWTRYDKIFTYKNIYDAIVETSKQKNY